MELEAVTQLVKMSPADRLKHFKDYIKSSKEKARIMHDEGQAGTTVCESLCSSFDKLLVALYNIAVSDCEGMQKVALVANGGYGRGELFPGSDIDLLFLTPRSGGALSEGVKTAINVVLYGLWDLNLKVGHSVRSTSENVQEGKQDCITRTTLLDSRLIVGDEDQFLKFKKKYRKEAIDNDKANFFAERSADMKARYNKYAGTVYLQEPNVKESPGGLRDWHNLLWLADTATEDRNLDSLYSQGVVSEKAWNQIREAKDFLMRLRNEMHFRTGKPTDILSLQLQGEVAEAFNYLGDDILIKIENFMKDYYTHARNLHNRVMGAFETLNIEMGAFKKEGLSSLLPWAGNRKEEQREFDSFFSREGLLYAKNENIFGGKPHRLIRAFWHCQNFGFSPSPSLRKLIKTNLHEITDEARASLEFRELIEVVFSMRGRVGTTLRAMHRVGLLGEVFPEFGDLDCLVQHEFFHRYTADEHTLRCIDMLDEITDSNKPEQSFYRELFLKVEDPLALYIALLLHDTGRALNEDDHVDGSSQNAINVCERLQITGERKRLILFLVDHHLTFFQVATKKDIDDPEVVEEFCQQMKTVDRLEALFTFTYCDSLGTNPDGWSGWKELAITTLFKRARKALRRSKEETERYHNEILRDQKQRVLSELSDRYHESVGDHFEEMPLAYFRYRKWDTVALHVKAIWQYENRRRRRPDTPFEAAVQWFEYPDLKYTEVCVVAEDKENLLASICCAFATHGVNILSANAHTRSDGIVLDLFKVCTMDQEALTDVVDQMEIVTTVYELNKDKTYDPKEYIVEKKSFFDQKPAICVTPTVLIGNDEDCNCTVLEVHATDRIGLSHDLLDLFTVMGVATKGARLTTERSTAIDSFLLQDKNGKKLDESLIEDLRQGVLDVATCQ